MDNRQVKHLLEGIKITIMMQQGMAMLKAERGDETINRPSDGISLHS